MFPSLPGREPCHRLPAGASWPRRKRDGLSGGGSEKPSELHHHFTISRYCLTLPRSKNLCPYPCKLLKLRLFAGSIAPRSAPLSSDYEFCSCSDRERLVAVFEAVAILGFFPFGATAALRSCIRGTNSTGPIKLSTRRALLRCAAGERSSRG